MHQAKEPTINPTPTGTIAFGMAAANTFFIADIVQDLAIIRFSSKLMKIRAFYISLGY
jgi:hypothetical protein